MKNIKYPINLYVSGDLEYSESLEFTINSAEELETFITVCKNSNKVVNFELDFSLIIEKRSRKFITTDDSIILFKKPDCKVSV